MTLPAAVFPLSVSGAKIMGADGQPHSLGLGVNWGGAQQDECVPYGLDRLPRSQIIDRIVGWGMSHVRLPFALGTIVNSNGTLKTALAKESRLTANGDLQGLTPWGICQVLADDLTAAGLYVILDCHQMYAGWPVPVTTQILTRTGWKSWQEVEPGEDETLGYADGELIWTPVTRVQQRGNQPVIRFGSDRWNTVCTPDHRWLTRTGCQRNGRSPEWGPVQAESAFTAWHSKKSSALRAIAGARRLVLTGYAEGGKSPCTSDEARIIAWLKTDGNVTWRTDNGGVTAYITQSESKHATEIRDLLQREDAMTSETTDNHASFRKTVMHRFRIRASYVRRLWADYSLGDPDLIAFVLSLTREARAAFLDAWRKADGSRGQIASHPGPRLDAIALAAFCEGYLVQEYSGARHHGISLSREYHPGNGPGTRPVYEDAGTAEVWCPTTGLGSWVARDKDGRIFVTGNCCSDIDKQGLWYNDTWPSSTFSNTWFLVAGRFKDNPMVGYDLKNEPRAAVVGGTALTPTWGDEVWGTDFKRMYDWHVSQLRAIDPDCLIFCEGLAYAGDLTKAGAQPVTGANIVYEAHDYSWYHAGQDQAAYVAANDRNWGYLAVQGKAPVWVGEVGASTDADTAAQDSGWLAWFLDYYASRPLAGACWWELAATAVLGTEPATNIVKMKPGQRESFGLMSGQDWLGSQEDVLAMLAPLLIT